MSKNNDNLTAIIDKFDNGIAVLEFSHNQTLTISKKYLPKDTKEGDALQVELLSDNQITKRKQNLAKAILEELLNSK